MPWTSRTRPRAVVGADGVANWSKIGGASPAASSPTEDKADWLVRAFDLERGMIDYRDLGSNAHGNWRGSDSRAGPAPAANFRSIFASPACSGRTQFTMR
jgi:hypothetical protein